jgi:biuret amidohydrolase
MPETVGRPQAIRPRGDDKMLEATSVLARPPLEPERTAIVVVDMINHQITRGKANLGEQEQAGVSVAYTVERLAQLVIPAHQRLLPAARAAGAKVVYLRLGALRPDYADAIPALKETFHRWEAHDGAWGCEVIEAITPEPGDLSLIKTGSGGFNSSALDVHLRGMDIDHVVYTGVVTNACVLLTLGAGFDLGYYGYLASDATATHSQRLQDMTEEIVSGYMAEVVTVDDLVGRLAKTSLAA